MDNILSPYWLTRQFINLLSSNVNMIHVSWLNFLPVIVRVLKVQYLYGNRATWNVFLYCRPNDLLGSVPMFMKLERKEGLSICDVGLTSDFYLLIYFLWFSWIWIFFFSGLILARKPVICLHQIKMKKKPILFFHPLKSIDIFEYPLPNIQTKFCILLYIY